MHTNTCAYTNTQIQTHAETYTFRHPDTQRLKTVTQARATCGMWLRQGRVLVAGLSALTRTSRRQADCRMQPPVLATCRWTRLASAPTGAQGSHSSTQPQPQIHGFVLWSEGQLCAPNLSATHQLGELLKMDKGPPCTYSKGTQ